MIWNTNDEADSVPVPGVDQQAGQKVRGIGDLTQSKILFQMIITVLCPTKLT